MYLGLEGFFRRLVFRINHFVFFLDIISVTYCAKILNPCLALAGLDNLIVLHVQKGNVSMLQQNRVKPPCRREFFSHMFSLTNFPRAQQIINNFSLTTSLDQELV